jgi:hypothetical protein
MLGEGLEPTHSMTPNFGNAGGGRESRRDAASRHSEPQSEEIVHASLKLNKSRAAIEVRSET